MRHTAFLVLGTDYNNISIDLKKYVLMYGEGDTDRFFHVINWENMDGIRTISLAEKSLIANNEFCSGLEDEFMTEMQNAVTIKTEEELEHFFSDFYDKTLTINNQGDSDSLHLYLLLPLYDKSLWDEAKQIMSSLGKIRQSYKVNLVGFSDDMAQLFINEEDIKQLPNHYKEFKENTKNICKEIVSYKNKHRFIMIQNRNAKGVALNLNHDSMIAVIGELALLCIENYTSIFPLSEEYEPCEVNAFGLSALRLDKFHFVHYLLRRAYLKVLERENVIQKEVEINKVSQIAQNSLGGHVGLMSSFYEKVVNPLIKKGISDDEIIVEIAPKLDEQIAEITQNIQDFINRKDLSLPEKQATLAQILGTDDELLKGYQFHKQQLTIDDCGSEAVNLYIEENNKSIKRITTENGEQIVIPAVLNTPCDKDGNVYLPLNELKSLKADIKESTNYIRQKSKELEELKEQLHKDEQSEIRLTENGFTYGNTLYKLLDVEEKPLQDIYEAKEYHRPSVDLRSSFGDIKDQGQLGTCSVFSLVSIYEYILKKSKIEKDLSERFVYYNILNDSGSMEDNGSSLYGVVESMTKYGVCAEEYCAYDVELYDYKPSVDAYKDAMNHKVKVAKNVKISHNDITSALSEGYPVTISLKIYESFGNPSKGFIFRPTEEEIHEAKYGNHAMVICGYSEEDKVYIVRNSWGKGFGDKGYCYIPFSYIEDNNFTNSACIITAVNEEGKEDKSKEDKGADQQTAVSFNKTDMEIRYSIIRILVDEEKIKLNEKKLTYGNLRIDYEKLIQTLCNNSKRNEIIDKGKERRKIDIVESTNEYNNFINKERSEILTAYKVFDKVFVTILSGVLIAIIVWSVCFSEISDWLTYDWNWYLIGGVVLTSVILVCYVSQRKHYQRILLDELEEKAQQMALAIDRKKKENNLLRLRLYIAGMIIDKLSDLQKELNNKYTLMKSYVGNLSVWYKEELNKVEQMDSPMKEPFVSLLSNDILNEYFVKEGERITDGLYLYEYLNGYNLSEEGIKEYKTRIKRELIEVLIKPLEGFKLLSYIQGKEYPFLNQYYSNVGTLLPLLERKSEYFLQTAINNIDQRNEVAKHIFLYLATQNDIDYWNKEFPEYFQKKPSSESIVSPYKLIVFQKINLEMNNVVDLVR